MRWLTFLLFCSSVQAAYVLKTVKASGGDYTPAQLQTALNDAATYQIGTACIPYIIEWEAGTTFSSLITLPAKDPTVCKEFVHLRSSRISEMPEGTRISPSSVTFMPTLEATGGYTPVVTASNTDGLHATGYWRLSGLEVKKAAAATDSLAMMYLGETSYVTREQTPDHITVDRCYIHGKLMETTARIGVYIAIRHLVLRDNYISEIQQTDTEAKAVLVVNSPGPLYIDNNYMSASMIQLLVGGATPAIPGLLHGDIKIRNNAIIKKLGYWNKSGAFDPTDPCYDDQYWTNSSSGNHFVCTGGTWGATAEVRPVYAAKNSIDIKNGVRVELSGNVIRYAWGGGFHQTGSGLLFNQTDGDPISNVYAYWARPESIIVEGNKIENTTDGITFGLIERVGYPYFQYTKDVMLKNNILTGLSDPLLTKNSAGSNDSGFACLKVSKNYDMHLEHITCQTAASVPAGFNFFWGSVGSSVLGISFNWHVQDSVSAYGGGPSGGGGIDTDTNGPGCSSLTTLGYLTGINTISRIYFTTDPTITLTPVPSTQSSCSLCQWSNCWPSTGGWTLSAQADMYVTPGSDYTVKAGSPAKGAALDGADAGVDVELVNWATATTEAGTPNSFNEFVIRSVIPAANGAVIDAVLPSGGTVTSTTVAGSRNWASPVGSASVVQTGRRAVITVTGVAPATHYYFKVISTGYRREGEFITRP